MNSPLRFAVIGNPITQSLSPEVHRAFARDCGIDLEYEKLFAPANGFPEAAQDFFDSGGRGMNVTAPFKGNAAAWVDQLDNNAALTESVNTIALAERIETRGHSTDGPGLVADLRTQWGLTLKGLRILVVGAGGATRGIVPSLLQRQPERVVVANRTLARAETLVHRFDHLGKNKLQAHSFDLHDASFDLVINATSGRFQSPASGVARALNGALCYDLTYSSRQVTAFCGEATRQGAEDVRDGLGMLVWQAAFSFEIWHGVLPDAESVLRELRDPTERT